MADIGAQQQPKTLSLSPVGKLAFKSVLTAFKDVQTSIQTVFAHEVEAQNLDAAEWQLDAQRGILVRQPIKPAAPAGENDV